MTTLEKPEGILLVVSGAAGTGKSMIDKGLISSYPGQYRFSVSATTRAPRAGETDGVDYTFVSKDEFLRKIKDGEMLEYTEYCGNYYGTPKSELEKLKDGANLILEIETEGASNIKRLCPDSVTVFVLPPDYETLKNRLEGRGTNTAEDIKNRLNKAISEFELVKNYDYAVVNPEGELDEAIKTVHGIVEGEKHKTSRGVIPAVKRIFPKR